MAITFQLRKKYTDLIKQAEDLIQQIQDKNKKINIYEILIYGLNNAFKPDIIEDSDWNKLNDIWKEMHVIESYKE